jgi:hypothetical protein
MHVDIEDFGRSATLAFDRFEDIRREPNGGVQITTPATTKTDERIPAPKTEPGRPGFERADPDDEPWDA